MKTTIFLSLVGIVAFLVSCDKTKNEGPDPTAALQKMTDDLYKKFDDKWNVEQGGFFVYISGPSGAYMSSANVSPSVTDQTHIRIASISKTFTAAAILLLEQDDRLELDDPISAHLPKNSLYDIPHKDDITIRQLLQHRSGVFDVTNQDMPETIDKPYAGKRYFSYVREELDNDDHTFTFDEMVGLVSTHQLSNFLPNERFEYSNTGYNILGKIVEELSGMSFSEFISKNFFEKLHLTNTYSVWNGKDQKMKYPFVNSFMHFGDEPPVETSEDNMSVHVTEGDIVSTPSDIARWMRLLMTGEAGISPANVNQMKEMLPADESHGVYGLGLTKNDGLGYGHDGAHLSYVSTLRYNPNNDITVLIVANFMRFEDENDFESFTDLAFAVRDAGLEAVKAYQGK